MNHHIAALLLERDGYIARGLHDRVAMVNDVLRSLGHVVDVVETSSIEHDVETTTRKKPTRRKKG
jgi:hypothetical protein